MFIIVYDVTNEESFKSSSKWLKRVQAQKFSPDSSLPGSIEKYLHYFDAPIAKYD